MKQTHWKQLVNPDYLGAYSLQPNEVRVLTIASVTNEKVKGQGGKSQSCMVVKWQEKEKPMILNRTNAKTISKIAGTPYIEQWNDLKVMIYAEPVEAFGEIVEALRIKQEKFSLPELNESMPAFQKAIDHIQKGGQIEDIQKRYTLSSETIKTLLSHVIS